MSHDKAPQASAVRRLNHSSNDCKVNIRWDSDSHCVEYHAMQPVKAKQEVTSSYGARPDEVCARLWGLLTTNHNAIGGGSHISPWAW